jgi:hypothetical protein
MGQQELNEAVARKTGESLCVINERGFSMADPLDVNFDPEPRRPLMLDWDTMLPTDCCV